MDVEPPHDRPARDLGLKLRRDFGLDDAAVAARAGVGQFGLVALRDLLGGRFGPMAVGAMLFAGLATWGLRVELGRSFAKGGGLAFARAKHFVELAGQLGELGFEFGHALLQRHTAGQAGWSIAPS